MRSPQHWFAATSSLALVTLLGGGVLAGQSVPADAEPVVAVLAAGEIPPQLERVEHDRAVDPLLSSAAVVTANHGTRALAPAALAKLR